MVGHGSSDNAASYGVYAFGLLPAWTAMRDSISLSVYYGAQVDLRGSSVLGLSQSGQTPDVLEYVERARARGAFTIGITNEPDVLARDRADVVLPLAAGPEHAIAATKTYTNQIAALALLAGYAAGRGPELVDGIRRTADLLEELLPTLERRVSELAVSLAFVGRMFVIGRGTEFATAREISLKLLETCRVAAEPLDGDRPHPRACGRDRRPVPGLDDRVGGREPARRAGGGGPGARSRGDADRERHRRRTRSQRAEHYLPVPAPPLPILTPLLSVAPGQLLAWALAQATGPRPRSVRAA